MKAERLKRLAKLHEAMVSLLETRLAALRARMDELDRSKTGMMQAIERTSTSGFGFYAGAVRRLAEIDDAKLACEEAIDELRRKLVSVRIRQKTFMRQSITERAAHERRETDATLRDVALQMKATGKHGVMK